MRYRDCCTTKIDRKRIRDYIHFIVSLSLVLVIMQHLLLLSVLLFTCISTICTYPCDSSCCTITSCCARGGTNCCNRESNCCRRDNSCCSNEECRCPNGRRDCADDDCCPTHSHPPIPPTRPPAPVPSSYPPGPMPPSAPTPYPIVPIPPSNSSYYSNNTNISHNNNTITIPTNINIQNEMRSETHISIPVSIKVDTVNTINIKQEDSKTSNDKCYNTTITGPNEKTNCTVQVVTVKVPAYRPIPVPYIITVHIPVPVPQGCCQVVTPCSPYIYGGCQQSTTRCSQDCSESHLYQPSNVCESGCYRRNTAMGGYCGHGGCYRRQVDCGTCGGRFFEDYESFLRCSGCFVPMF